MPDAVAHPAPRSLPASQPQPASQAEIHRTGAAGKRLAWLDALRGIAALCVVFDHLTYTVLQPVRHAVYYWFDPGQYGVFVFFLVSGYIVPASLGRKGSARGFWMAACSGCTARLRPWPGASRRIKRTSVTPAPPASSDKAWMPHSRRVNDMAGTSTSYER